MLVPGVYVDSFISIDASDPIVAHANGLPYVVTGALATGSGPITHWNQGIPFNAAGRVVASSGVPVWYQVGYAFDEDGALCVFENGEGFGLIDVDVLPDEIPESAEIGDPVGIQVYGSFPGVNPVEYSITTQTTPGAFGINATTGVVTVAAYGLLDYEERPTETVTIRATDTVTDEYVELEFTITVGDVTADLNELWSGDQLVWLTESGAEPSVWRI